MVGLFSLLGAIVGGVNGIAPKLINAWDDHRKSNNEMKIMEMQHKFQMEMAKTTANTKIEEGQLEALSEDIKAQGEIMKEIVMNSFVKTGYEWVDKINACIRPSFMVMVLIFIVILASISMGSLLGDYVQGKLAAKEIMLAINGTWLGALVEGGIGWFLGYRSVVSKTSK